MSGSRRERKVVTVLFADLVGFTARAEALDPEDVEAVLEPYHKHVRAELEQYGGSVEKFIGDAAMAVFGAPIAHEDDPERAVRAALAIRDWIVEQGELEVRLAVNTGEVLVNLDARPESGERFATGDVVNTTSRLQAAAPVNGVLVGEATYRATARAVDYRAVEPVTAKGKAAQVPVWEALQARSRLGIDVARYHMAPFVGRARELRAVHEALQRALERRSPQLMTIVGAPGIGKSRLVYELMQTVAATPEFVIWRQGRSLPYGDGASLRSLAEIVKAQAGIMDGDSDKDAAAKLSRSVAEIQPEDPEWVLRHLRPLVGFAADGDGATVEQTERFAAWRRFLEALADRRPAVLVFEDLHWADDTLLDFVDHLAEWTSGVPLLMVGTARPELLERRPAWGGGKLNATTLALAPLAQGEIAQIVHSLLGRAVIGADEQDALLSRAGGNPLYAEQYARMLGERGSIVEPGLPESVQGIIAARLDGLSRPEKTLLQDAAVVGKVFWSGALVALGPGRANAAALLHGLERKDFVQRARRSSVAGSDEYAFRHVLVRDVAYGQIPRADRGDKHRLVAEWFESLGRPDDHAATLAHHYTTALQLARASGGQTAELEERSRLALDAAGDRAYVLNAVAQAVRFYEDALELWPRADRTRPSLLFKLGRVRRLDDETGIDELEEAIPALLALDDHATAAEAETVLADLRHLRGDRKRADEHLARAAELVRDLPPSPAKASVLGQLARFHMLDGACERAVEIAAIALEVSDALGLDQVRASVLNTRGVARVHLGDPDGLADVEESLALARRIGAPFEILRGYTNLAASSGLLGDVRRSHRLNLENLRVAEHLGVRRMSRWTRANLAMGHLQLGEWDEALRVADEFIAEVEAGAPHLMELQCRRVRAEIRIGRWDDRGALADAERAVEIARGAAAPLDLVLVLAAYARVLIEVGRKEAAETAFDEIMALAEPAPAEALSFIESAYVARALGRVDEVRHVVERLIATQPIAWPRWIEATLLFVHDDLVGAADNLAAIGDLSWAARTRLAAAEALVRDDHRAEADHQLRSALGFYRRVGATRYISEGEALLAMTPRSA